MDRQDRWSGVLLAMGVVFGLVAANRLLAKPFTNSVWFAGYGVQTIAAAMSCSRSRRAQLAPGSERNPDDPRVVKPAIRVRSTGT